MIYEMMGHEMRYLNKWLGRLGLVFNASRTLQKAESALKGWTLRLLPMLVAMNCKRDLVTNRN